MNYLTALLAFSAIMIVLATLATVVVEAIHKLALTKDGIGWLLSALLAGGLIGLGAPFWFKTYKFLADFVPSIKPSERTQARRTGTTVAAEEAASAQSIVSGVQPNSAALGEAELLDAFVKSKR